jgi:ferritin-like metal-binding protein YciE
MHCERKGEMKSTKSTEKIIQYLNEAHATEQALTRTLQAHIAMTPSGRYRSDLERHLRETGSHAKRVERRLGELAGERGLLQLGVGAIQSLLGQAIALSKGPLDLMRGVSGEEKLLKNAKDECSTEALEIATYISLEHLAHRVGDDKTAALAASIREDEERMLDRLSEHLPQLVDDAIRSELEGEQVYDISTTGAAQTARRTRRQVTDAVESTTKRAGSQARDSVRQARRVPGVARVEGEVKGAAASEADLAIRNYDELNADEILTQLSALSQIELAKIDAYERKNANRSTVRRRIASLRGDEPWPGYDEQSVGDVRKELIAADEEELQDVRQYERRHKDRQGILETAERKLNHSDA